jgi:hypothetical protein
MAVPKKPNQAEPRKPKRKRATPRKPPDLWLPLQKLKKPIRKAKAPAPARAGPPGGRGHIDRFYVTNCTNYATIQNVEIQIQPKLPGPLTIYNFATAIPPLQAQAFEVMKPSFDTCQIWIGLLFEWGGYNYQYNYDCHLPAANNEYIKCVAISLVWYLQGDAVEVLTTTGTLFGHEGNVSTPVITGPFALP